MKDSSNQEFQCLINRKNEYYLIDKLNNPSFDQNAFHVSSILDGELIINNTFGSDWKVKYLIFDCLMLDNINCTRDKLDERIRKVRDEIITPYVSSLQGHGQKLTLPFVMELKSMYFSFNIGTLFENILPNLQHDNDGVIFTPRYLPYKYGTDKSVYKWKPKSQITGDFRLHIDFPRHDLACRHISSSVHITSNNFMPNCTICDPIPIFKLFVLYRNSQYRHYANMTLSIDQWSLIKQGNIYDDSQIVECCMDESGVWCFKRLRSDKSRPNYIDTIIGVTGSMSDKVSESDLKAASRTWKSAWVLRNPGINWSITHAKAISLVAIPIYFVMVLTPTSYSWSVTTPPALLHNLRLHFKLILSFVIASLQIILTFGFEVALPRSHSYSGRDPIFQ